MAAMPGPDNIFVITESIAKGARNGVLISFGLNSGIFIHTIAATTGVSLILKQSELAFQVIQYLGAAYLLYMAYGAFKEKPIHLNSDNSERTKGYRIIRTGFIMNVLNPKVSLFFIAFLPQFVDTKEAWSEPIQLIVLGGIFMITGFLTFSSFALLASQLKRPLSSPSFWKAVKWIKVSVLLILTVYLVWP